MDLEFIETKTFTKLLAKYMKDDEYRALQSFLAASPTAGDVIQDAGGLRKVRWAVPARGKGKRGGARVIYYYFMADSQIVLFTIYGKNMKDDLSADERKAMKAAVEREKNCRLAARQAK